MVPKIGIYPGIDPSEYGTWDAANFSTLKCFRRSAAHAREMLVNPPEQTPAMLLGQATHAAVLEPNVFEDQYVAAPKLDRRFKADKEKWEAFQRDNKSKEILTAQEFDLCIAMREAALANPIVAEIVSEKGSTELGFVWDDAHTGQRCKGRCDRFSRLWGNSVISDLKTTENATPSAWEREVVKYAYHAQAAFYLDGLNECRPAMNRKFLWLVIEKNPPYALAIYEPDEATLDKGKRMYRNWLRQWSMCRETNVWPGYPASIQPLLLPEWALRIEEGEYE